MWTWTHRVLCKMLNSTQHVVMDCSSSSSSSRWANQWMMLVTSLMRRSWLACLKKKRLEPELYISEGLLLTYLHTWICNTIHSTANNLVLLQNSNQLVTYLCIIIIIIRMRSRQRTIVLSILHDHQPLSRPFFACWLLLLIKLSCFTLSSVEELALDRPLWQLLAVSGAAHWIGASWTMMMMMMI